MAIESFSSRRLKSHPWIQWRSIVVSGLVSGLLLSMGARTQGGTIRDDHSDSLYTTLANQPAFSSVGQFQWTASNGSYLASGTLINNQWVLTAAHVVDGITADNIGTMTFTLGVNTYHVSEVHFDSTWDGNVNDGNDIGLVKLTSSITNVAPAYLYNTTDEFHQIGTVVGYGETGNGLTGAVVAAGTKRAGTNVIGLGSVLNGISWTGGGNDNMIVADFDPPARHRRSNRGPVCAHGSRVLCRAG